MKKILITIVFGFSLAQALAQAGSDALFSSTDPLDIAFNMSVKTVRNSKVDSLYFKEKMYYRNAAGESDSIKIGLKRRGNFRLKHCYFPPLWMKIGTKNAKNTLFEGHKKLKLVMPCDSRQGSNDLIMREYLCYKLYEALTLYCFKSRLVNIDFTEEKGKKIKNFQLKGILIEDVEKTAKRFGGVAVENAIAATKALHDTCAFRFDLFQFLISNTDWSKGSQHNSKLIYHNTKYIPVPYDFDMSGVVDAPYSVVSKVGEDELPIVHVTERFYRGHCVAEGTTQFVRREFLSKKEKLLAVPDELKGSLPDKQIENIKAYLEKFFEILKDDYWFQKEITERCRPR